MVDKSESDKKVSFFELTEFKNAFLLVITIGGMLLSALSMLSLSGVDFNVYSMMAEDLPVLFIGMFTFVYGYLAYIKINGKKKRLIDERVAAVDMRRRVDEIASILRDESSASNSVGDKGDESELSLSLERIELSRGDAGLDVKLEKQLDLKQFRFKQYEGFADYFDGLRVLLENKSKDADEKASILLDKGIAYSKYGIYFFVAAIAVWQVLSHVNGFREQYIYGMISCSVVFVFVEFLSAWFLRQYRSYVDTSTYLVKIKSIFDRYMLSYLALNDKGDKDVASLIDMLGDEIKWPETYLMKNPDISFAREMAEAMGYMAQVAKKEAKSKKAESVS